MRRLTAIALAMAALLGIVVLAADPPATQPANNDGRLEASIELQVVGGKGQYRPDDPVFFTFTVKNVAKEPLAIWARNCSWGNAVYFFEVTTASGATISLHEKPSDWEKNVPTPKALAPGQAFSLGFDLTKLAGWKPMQVAVQIRGVYEARNEFKGKPDWPHLQTLWEGRLVTEPVKLTFAGQAQTAPAATAPAAQAQPVDYGVIEAAKLDALVDDLASDDYRRRQQAKEQLKSLVVKPGVGDMLVARRSKVSDPQAKLSVDELLAIYRRPLVMIWPTGLAVIVDANANQPGKKPLPSAQPSSREFGYPWLFVRGDGTFLYDAGSQLFTGKPGESEPDYWQGTLDRRSLGGIRALVERLGLGTPPSVPGCAGMYITFFVQSSDKANSVNTFWPVESFTNLDEVPPPKEYQLDLVKFFRHALAAAADSVAYDGQWGAVCQYVSTPNHGISRTSRELSVEQINKLPAWPVKGVNFTGQPQIGPLTPEQLAAVREALPKAEIYSLPDMPAAVKIRLAPYVKDACELFTTLKK